MNPISNTQGNAPLELVYPILAAGTLMCSSLRKLRILCCFVLLQHTYSDGAQGDPSVTV